MNNPDYYIHASESDMDSSQISQPRKGRLWVPILILVNLFPDVQTMSATIDRLSPLMMLVYPLAYMIGYLLGPKMNRKRETQNRRAKKIAVRRTQKHTLAAELTGAQPQVHYGHKKEEEKHKRRELI